MDFLFKNVSAFLFTGGSLTHLIFHEWGRHFLNPWPEALMSQACGLQWQLWDHQGWCFRNSSQQGLTTSQDTKVSPSENQTLGLRGPQRSPLYLEIGKKPLLWAVSQMAPREAAVSGPEETAGTLERELPNRTGPPFIGWCLGAQDTEAATCYKLGPEVLIQPSRRAWVEESHNFSRAPSV